MINAEEKSVDRDFIIENAKRLIPIKSISPESGGDGESRRADEICRILDELGYSDYKKYETTDRNGVLRPSVILKVGNCEKTLWIISHIDTVPVGEINLWKHKPFEATVEGNRIYGRGSSDDGQAVFLSMLLLKNLKKENLKYNLGLAFVADEEVGSKYGISFLLENDIFGKDDLFLVPDAGTEDGLEIEIAEKSILWIKFKIAGKQYHASMPSEAINANRETMKFILQLDEMLHSRYPDTSDIFDPPYSTFEPTKHEKNVDNVNTIPGIEVQYVDCRILPKYDLDYVIDDIDSLIKSFHKTSKARVSYELFQKEQAPFPTDENSAIVKELKAAIRKVKGKEPRVVGIGGGTCAAFFRRKGMDAAVWSTTVKEVAHQPDEYCVVDHILGDQKVIEEMIYSR